MENNLCSVIEVILLKNINERTAEEIELLDKHLKNCNKCRDFADNISEFETRINNDELKEAPLAIKQNLLDVFEKQKNSNINFVELLFQSLKELFNLKIPIYQLALLFLLLWGSKAIYEVNSSKMTTMDRNIEISIPETYYANTLNKLVSNIKPHGQSVSEDSLLFNKFRYTF